VEQSKQNLLSDLELIAKSYFIRFKNKINYAHDWDHVQRVKKNCEKILKFETSANKLEVQIAVILHDIGRFKDDLGDHAEWSYFESKEILKAYYNDFAQDADINKILNIIRYHSTKLENVPNKDLADCLEFKILIDADKIDSFGPYGILRAPLDKRFDTISKQIDHIKEKIDVNNFTLQTNGGKIVGKKFQDSLSDFLKVLKDQESFEIADELRF